MLSLLAGGALVSSDQNLMNMFGHLNNESWAYLVSNQEILSQPWLSDGEAKKKRLEAKKLVRGRDSFMRLSIIHKSPSILTLYRKKGPIRRGKDKLFFLGRTKR